MAGHSKWLKVKHPEGPLDVECGVRSCPLIEGGEDRSRRSESDAWAGDISDVKDCFILTLPPDRFRVVGEASLAGGIALETPRSTYGPDVTVPIGAETRGAWVPHSHEAFENRHDARGIHPNFDTTGKTARRPQS